MKKEIHRSPDLLPSLVQFLLWTQGDIKSRQTKEQTLTQENV